MKHIMKCPKCGKYTMRIICPRCKNVTQHTTPAKWSPDDLYGKYRREAKRALLKESGLL